jgi:sec-independent protein translocase protein TatC
MGDDSDSGPTSVPEAAAVDADKDAEASVSESDAAPEFDADGGSDAGTISKVNPDSSDVDEDGDENDENDGTDDEIEFTTETNEELDFTGEIDGDPVELDEPLDHTTDEAAVGDGTGEGSAQIGYVDPTEEEYGDYDDDDDGFLSGPETDEEMPLADHIEEMVRRLFVVIAFGGLATLLAFPTADFLINYFWNAHIPQPMIHRPHLFGPLELILTELKVASLAGVIVALPVFVYETYLFMRPGLYPHERRYYLAAIPTSLVLALIGAAFAHFLVLPVIFAYFTSYTTGAAEIAFALSDTFNLILLLMGYMSVVFQIPLFIMLAIMMNLVTRVWLEDKRLIFWGVFLTLSFVVSPDPTGMAPIIVAVTMVVLFEGTLALLRWTGH